MTTTTTAARPDRRKAPGSWFAGYSAASSELPAIVIADTRSVGDAVELLKIEIVADGVDALPQIIDVERDGHLADGEGKPPFSIQKPDAPREKSPVIALKPKPIISVT